MEHDLKRSVGFQIAKARLASGYTQEELAERVGRSVEAISNLERGKSFPEFETLTSLAEHLNVQVSHFFDGDPLPTSSRTRMVLRLNAIAGLLSDEILSVAIEQLEALGRLERGTKAR